MAHFDPSRELMAGIEVLLPGAGADEFPLAEITRARRHFFLVPGKSSSGGEYKTAAFILASKVMTIVPVLVSRTRMSKLPATLVTGHSTR